MDVLKSFSTGVGWGLGEHCGNGVSIEKLRGSQVRNVSNAFSVREVGGMESETLKGLEFFVSYE